MGVWIESEPGLNDPQRGNIVDVRNCLHILITVKQPMLENSAVLSQLYFVFPQLPTTFPAPPPSNIKRKPYKVVILNLLMQIAYCKITFTHLTQLLRSHAQSFGQLLKSIPFVCQVQHIADFKFCVYCGLFEFPCCIFVQIILL